MHGSLCRNDAQGCLAGAKQVPQPRLLPTTELLHHHALNTAATLINTGTLLWLCKAGEVVSGHTFCLVTLAQTAALDGK